MYTARNASTSSTDAGDQPASQGEGESGITLKSLVGGESQMPMTQRALILSVAWGLQPSPDSLYCCDLQGLVGAVMGFGVLNRVLYKMALVPLGDYVFFLAQFQTFGWVQAVA